MLILPRERYLDVVHHIYLCISCLLNRSLMLKYEVYCVHTATITTKNKKYNDFTVRIELIKGPGMYMMYSFPLLPFSLRPNFRHLG